MIDEKTLENIKEEEIGATNSIIDEVEHEVNDPSDIEIEEEE